MKWLRIVSLVLILAMLGGQVLMIHQRQVWLKQEDAAIEQVEKNVVATEALNEKTYNSLCRTYLRIGGSMPNYCNADGTYKGEAK